MLEWAVSFKYRKEKQGPRNLRKGIMIGIRQLVSFGLRFLNYMLVNVLLGWIADIILFNRINQVIDDLFIGENGTEDGTRGVYTREVTGTSDGQIGQRGA